MSENESENLCIYKMKKGFCGRECLPESKFCSRHALSKQADAMDNPCQFIKKDESQCLHKATKGKYCGTHSLVVKRREKMESRPQCQGLLKNGEQCSRRVRDGSEYCSMHLKCECGKRVHSLSLTHCLDCDPDSKCRENGCNKVVFGDSEDNYCRLHYRIHEAKNICMWPAGCRKKPYEKSAHRYCKEHHQIRNMPQCTFLVYTRKTNTLALCIDKKHGHEDVYCKRHNKGCKITSESLSDDVDDHAIDVGKAVHIARRDGTALDVKLTMADNRLGQQLLFDAREAQYLKAIEQGLVTDENVEDNTEENADNNSEISPPVDGIYHMNDNMDDDKDDDKDDENSDN